MKRTKFPLDCKIAQTQFILQEKVKNYHLISLLPFVSKVIEKVIRNQTETF